MLVRDPDITEPNIQLPCCCVQGCRPGIGGLFQVWGDRRLCLVHYEDFKASELSWTCSDRGKGPTEAEWNQFLSGLRAKERVA